MKGNIETCDGKGCPIRLVCYRYAAWMVSDDDEPDMPASFRDGKCPNMTRREFYGQ